MSQSSSHPGGLGVPGASYALDAGRSHPSRGRRSKVLQAGLSTYRVTVRSPQVTRQGAFPSPCPSSRPSGQEHRRLYPKPPGPEPSHEIHLPPGFKCSGSAWWASRWHEGLCTCSPRSTHRLPVHTLGHARLPRPPPPSTACPSAPAGGRGQFLPGALRAALLQCAHPSGTFYRF